jgi:hypothetical protein
MTLGLLLLASVGKENIYFNVNLNVTDNGNIFTEKILEKQFLL